MREDGRDGGKKNDGRRNDGKKDDKKKDRRKKKSKLMQRSSRDVELMMQPSLNAIEREGRTTQEDYLQGLQAARAAYGGYSDELAGLPGIGEEDIAGRLGQHLSSLQSMFGGGGMPSSEMGAASALGGVLGAGGMGDIYNMAARNDMYGQSAAREGALAQRYAEENLGQSMEDALESLRNRRLDLTDQSYLLQKQRLDELKQQQLENQLVRNQMQNDEAFSEWLMGDLNSAANRGGGGGGGGGRGNSGGGGGGGGNNHPNYPQFEGPPRAGGGGGGGGQEDATVQDWRRGDARWKDLSKQEHRRIKRKGIQRRQPRGRGRMV